MVRFISQTFLKGLTVLLPIVATLYILNWLISSSESLVRGAVTRLIPDQYYIPGMGIAILLGALFLIGLLMYSWLAQKIVQGFDKLFRKLPLISSIYSPFRDLMDMFGGDFADQLGKPVIIKVPGTEMETLGFITRRDLSNLPDGISKEGHVVVYVQWSSQIGGYCFIVPEDSVREVDMTVEDGMRWSLTAGLSGPGEKSR